MGAALRGASLRVPPFWIRHCTSNLSLKIRSAFQFLAQVAQRRPSGIGNAGSAIAALDVQVAAAMRTQSLAVRAAKQFHRQRQQYLLFEGIFQQQTLTLIITNL